MSEKQKKYDYEVIEKSGGVPSRHYRIRDVASDNRIATCFDKANADLIVRALNVLGEDYMTMMRAAVARESLEG